jgi:hypothetical protein
MNTFTIKKWQYALLLLVAFAAISSCKKENAIEDPAPIARPRLSKIAQDANNFMTFGYNSDGYLNKFKMVNDYLSSEIQFGYNNLKKPIAGTWDGFDMEFIYEGGLLSRVNFTASTPNPLIIDHYLQFTYSNGRVSQTTDYLKQGENFVQGAKHTYEYYANGDMKAETYLYPVGPENWEQVERNVYEYDDKINAIQMPDEVAYVLYLNKSAHNFKKITTYDASDGLDETQTYSFIYNQFGLPTTGVETTIYPNSPTINRTLTYSYQ